MFDFYQPDFQPTKLYPFQNLSLNILINIYLIEKKKSVPEHARALSQFLARAKESKFSYRNTR